MSLRSASPFPAEEILMYEITLEMARLWNAPDWKTVDAIPKEIYPHMNSLTPWQRKAANAKQVFELMMAEAESPTAPPIRIFNSVDDEPCPTFEFVYTNEMYYDHDVPGPDHENLKGCKCIGGCDPKSRGCSCANRQRWWTGGRESGKNYRFDDFAWDTDGKIKDWSFPVFECNWKCGCDETCQNRVSGSWTESLMSALALKVDSLGCSTWKTMRSELSQDEEQRMGCVYLSVLATGLYWCDSDIFSGVFAGREHIVEGTFLGIYAGELISSDRAEALGE
jgi:hypothetical protein